MKIPLSVYPTEDSLLIYRNGTVDKVPFPLKPFALIQADKCPMVSGPEVELTKVPEDEVRKYKRIEFGNQNDLYDFRKKFSDYSRHIFVNQYVEQLYISKEDFLLAYPHTNDLKIMFFDIEVATKGDGLFPKPLNNEILCIGFSVWHYTNDGKRKKITQQICRDFDDKTMSDLNVLEEFFDSVQQYDPDIIAGYFSSEFDMPYIIERAKIIKADLTKMGRGGREPSISKNGLIRIPGRIHFDILTSNAGVSKDQTLYGIKSLSLKELSRWYKVKRTVLEDGDWVQHEMEDIELPHEIEDLMKLRKENPDRLYAYQNDDVFRTEGVGHVYLRNCITLAELMKVPLESIMNMYSSFVPKLFVARHMEKLGLINTETNFNKYNIQNGSIAPVGNKYEGAIVGLYKDGYFPATWKLDFASQYPSSIMTWNLGPDTTSLVRVEEYTGTYKHTRKGSYDWYRIPTKFEKGKYRYDFIVKVRNDKEGFLKKEIKKLKEERVKIKAEYKKADDETVAMLNSQQYAIKVIMNCFHPDTEILAEDGIKLLKDVKVGEKVWSINPQTFEAELKEVEKTYEYDIKNQEFYNINHKRFSQGITEGHKMLGYNDNKCFFEEAKDFTKRKRVKIPGHLSSDVSSVWIDLLDYVDSSKYELLVLHDQDLRKLKNEFPQVVFKKAPTIKGGSYIMSSWNEHVKELCNKNYTVLARCKRSKLCSAVPVRVANSSFSDFVGWYLSEGSIYTSTTRKYDNITRGVSHKITISQDEGIDNSYRQDISDTLNFLFMDSLKCQIYQDKKGFQFSSDLYKDIIDNHFGSKFNKFVSKEMMSSLNLRNVLDSMYKGDGTKNQRRYTISCKNTSLFNSYLEMLIKTGRMFTYSIDSGCYRIVDKEGDITLKDTNTTKSKYSGKVYSLTVKDNHTVYAGLNGNLGWIGQSIYGFLGLKSSTYGDMISAVMVTAMCRWCILKCMQRNVDCLIETDTDGIVVDKFLDENKENAWLKKELEEKFQIKDNYMELELEGNGERAFFYLMKNYIVEDEPGKYSIHGSSMKASRSAKIVDRAIKLGIEYVFNNKPKEEVIREAFDFSNVPLEDFTERVKLSKEPREYDDQYDARLFLAKQVEMKTGQIVTKGTQISYVITKEKLPYEEFQPYYKARKYAFIKYVEDKDELDMKYYETLVNKALMKFGISLETYQQTNLFAEVEVDIKPIKPKNKKLDTVPMEEI